MKADYDRELEDAYLKADQATHGYMVNKEGNARGLRGKDVYYRQPRFASEELRAHWAKHPRPTLAGFEKQWLDEARWLEVA
jgi:hypothetical protein